MGLVNRGSRPLLNETYVRASEHMTQHTIVNEEDH